MVSEFIDMVKTGADSRPNENSIVPVIDDGQIVLKADWLPWAPVVKPEFYDLYCRNPAEYS
jgi:hypothetical protein